MATKLCKYDYWVILNRQGKFMLDNSNLPIIRKTRGELLDWANFYYAKDEINQMIYNGQTYGAFPRIAKIKLTYQVI